MSKNIIIKITKASPNTGPFNITTEFGDIIALNVPRIKLILGTSYTVDDNVNVIMLESLGACSFKTRFPLGSFTKFDYSDTKFKQASTGCLWRHLKEVTTYNHFYGKIHSYIIEYPFSFNFEDEILQNIKDYTKAFQYLPMTQGEFTYNNKIEIDNIWFNKAILYNGQQSSGLLLLEPKPKNNLSVHSQYPKYNVNSKTISFVKSDNFYQYNTFWALNISPYTPLFINSCESMSVDKHINEANMDYSTRSFKKAPLRAKDLKVRHILDNNSKTHLVSQFILAPSQISYK